MFQEELDYPQIHQNIMQRLVFLSDLKAEYLIRSGNIVCESFYLLMHTVKNAQVSDTTGDAMKSYSLSTKNKISKISRKKFIQQTERNESSANNY